MFSTAIAYICVLTALGLTGVVIMLNFNFTFGLIILIVLIPLTLVFIIKLGLEREKIIRENNENLKKLVKITGNLLELKLKDMEIKVAENNKIDNQ